MCHSNSPLPTIYPAMLSPSTHSHLTTIAFVIGVGSLFAALLIMLDYFYPNFCDDWIRRRRQQHEVLDLELQHLPHHHIAERH